MKKLHLICNSHIDPVWMWDWEEGLGTGISTFYQAAEFCDEYDYIFNHNEAVLYEFIEEHDPVLFAKIQKLVKEGKWHIMGGWYLQPDCNIPSGEAFVRQIKLGLRYFEEKFEQRPTVAINFDSFGHSVGLVQILAKCGYNGYIACRPMPEMVELPGEVFTWIGKDESQVKVFRPAYASLYTGGVGKIKKKANVLQEDEVSAVPWGVGNHGGGPSREDFKELSSFMETVSFPIVHSTPENFIQEAKSCGDFRKSLQPCLVGAYTSMNSVKQKHLELETKLFSTEKLCSIAALNEKYKWNNAPFERAEKALSMLAFHDILSGTCGPDGEKSSLRKADCAIELLNDEFNKAFFAICTEHVKAGEGEFPIFMYNALPYKRVTECEVEYLMPDAIAPTEEEYFVTVKHGGNVIASQCVHELTNINYDRRKRIVFIAELAPVDVTRFDITVEKRKKVFLKGDLLEDIVVEDKFKRVVIGRKTGLLESFVVNGKEMISGDAFCPVMYDDNADPWGWYMDAVGKNPESFHLSSCKEGVFRDMEPVRIIEEGDIYTEVECLFELGRSSVRVSYKIYKNLPEMDVNVDVIWSDRLKALKIKVPTTLDGAFIGQIPFGTDTFPKDGTEITAHRFIAMEDGKHALTLYNDCTYGFSCDEKVMYATLLRGVAYCAHPLGDLPLIHDDRYIQSVEEGRHHFGFRLSYDKVSQLENRAQEFVNKPYGLNFFPHGQKVQGDIITKHLVIENQDISLVAFYQDGDEYVLRLINNSEEAKKCEIALCGSKFEFNFEKYEVKTFKYDGSVLEEATCMV